MGDAKTKNDNMTTITVKIDRDLYKAFENVDKDNNRNKSLLIRDFITDYVKSNGQLKLPV